MKWSGARAVPVPFAECVPAPCGAGAGRESHQRGGEPGRRGGGGDAVDPDVAGETLGRRLDGGCLRHLVHVGASFVLLLLVFLDDGLQLGETPGEGRRPAIRNVRIAPT